MHTFPWNDLDAFEILVKRHCNQIAAFVATPYHHPMFADSVLPAPGFFQGIQEICRREGIVFILDDIRAGFRLHLGGSHRCFGFEPDVICFSKALGNGYPISAALGRSALRIAASKVFLTGSFWFSAVPMAAALACLDIFRRGDMPEELKRAGMRLTRGLELLGREFGMPVRCSGPPALPYMCFAGASNPLQMQSFCAAAIRRGVFLHPHHNWFICRAHGDDDIDAALHIAGEAFVACAEQRSVQGGNPPARESGEHLENQ